MNNSDSHDTGLTRSLEICSTLVNAHKRMVYMNTQQQHRQQGHTLAKIQTVERAFIEASYLAVEGNCFQCFLGNRAVLTFDLYLGQINLFHITNPVWKGVNVHCLVLLTAHVQTMKPDKTCSIWLSASAKALHHYTLEATERCDALWLAEKYCRRDKKNKTKHPKSIKGSSLFCGHSTPYIRHLSTC